MTTAIDYSGTVYEVPGAGTEFGTSQPLDLDWDQLSARAQQFIGAFLQLCSDMTSGSRAFNFTDLTPDALAQLLRIANPRFAGRTWPQSAKKAALNAEGRIYFPEPCAYPLA